MDVEGKGKQDKAAQKRSKAAKKKSGSFPSK